MCCPAPFRANARFARPQCITTARFELKPKSTHGAAGRFLSLFAAVQAAARLRNPMVSPERCDRYAHLDAPERPGGSALDDSRSGNRARFTPESLDGSQSGRRARLLRTLELDADLAGLDGSRGSQRSGSGRDESRRSKSRTPPHPNLAYVSLESKDQARADVAGFVADGRLRPPACLRSAAT